MDAFFPRSDEPTQALTLDTLVDTLVERLGVHAFFSFTYQAAITTALISGEANIIGQYIEEEFTVTINLEDNTAVLSHAGEVLETYLLDKDDVTARLDAIRQGVAATDSKLHTPESLAGALVDSIWADNAITENEAGRAYLTKLYLADVTVAAVHGDARVISPEHERLDLVIHPTRPTATLCQGEEIIDAFKLDLSAFQTLRDIHSALVEGEFSVEEDAE